MDERGRQRQFEEQFLMQLRARAQALTRGPLPADRVEFEALPDGVDALRAELARLRIYDRDLLDQLPGARTVQLRFQRATLGGLLRTTVARLRAQVLAPVEALVSGGPVQPIGREQVLDALARCEVLPRRERPTAIVFASATGFTTAARATAAGSGQPSVILMGLRPDGGWDVELPDSLKRSPWAKLFAFETQDDQLKRLMYHLEQNANLLDSAGIPLPVLAEKLGLPPAQTDALVRRACRGQARLMTVVHAGVVHVARTPLAEEGNPMSMWSRIRKLLRLKPTVAERVREMTGQRVRIEQQRHELDSKINALEAEERQLIERGASTALEVERKQTAAKLIRVRRDLRRIQAQAAVYSQQIDILGTHVHHLTLAEQGRRLDLPRAEELTREAAQAEQVMAELAANADLATSIEVGAQTPMMAEEEAGILAEFQQAAASRTGVGAAPAAAPASGDAAARSGAAARNPAEPPPLPPARPKSEPARPELG